jgi:mannose-6-phosphate isomerase-like protein (cupin superfamily)
MRVVYSNEFTGKNTWNALDIEKIEKASIRLHWTDQPYIWHVNDGQEVFVVLDGKVEMHIRKDRTEQTVSLNVGDIFHAQTGDEHKAVPKGTARILVIETDGSI